MGICLGAVCPVAFAPGTVPTGKINETSATLQRVAGLSLPVRPVAKVELTGKFSTGASLSGFTPRLA
jgi:hypothetical protein